MKQGKAFAIGGGVLAALVLLFALLLASPAGIAVGSEVVEEEIVADDTDAEEEWDGQAKLLYDLVFYPPGKAPAGELEYDPIPFQELLPKWGGEQDVWDTHRAE